MIAKETYNNISVNLITFIEKIQETLFTLGTKKVKHKIILKIALLISILINLPRALSLFNITDKLIDSFSEVSWMDIVFRTLLLLVFSWIILLLNANWKDYYDSKALWVKTTFTVVANTITYFSFVKLFSILYVVVIGQQLSDPEVGLLYFVYFVILLICVFIASILRYQLRQQKQLLENEALKQQNLQKELTALKNQINPHFLFNSLNTLNSLVRGNNDATTFVNKLSFLYRYILQSGDRDLVTLKEEIKFLKSYIHLIKARYQDRFIIKMDIEDKYLTYEIPPLVLQLLVENAVKHNEISEEFPLRVDIFTKNDTLQVENIIKPRRSLVNSTGNGLINLDKRFFLLKKEHILIRNTNGKFIVKLPLKDE